MSTKLSDLITAVRDRIDEPTENRWTDAELTRYINKRVTWLQSRIETFNNDYFLRVATFTASVGDNNFGVPSDMLGANIRHIRCYAGQTSAVGQGTRMQPAPLEFIYDNQYTSGTPQFYTFLSNEFKWTPTLSSDSFFRFVYTIKETTLTGSNSTLSYIKDEHTDVIADGAAIDALIKVGAYNQINALRQNIQDRFLEVYEDVSPRDPIQIPIPIVDDYEVSD